jgi:hypothetical protein
MLLSLFQLIKHAGYQGTVVGMDEAEQGFSVDFKKLSRILSMLKSDVDSIADLQSGSVLILYAISPDLREKMDELPPLQQRLADPGGVGFFRGNYLAPVIDLSLREDHGDHLRRIGERLVEVFVDQQSLPTGVTRDEALLRAQRMAQEIAQEDQSSSSRRVYVKRLCSFMLGIPEAEPAGTEF